MWEGSTRQGAGRAVYIHWTFTSRPGTMQSTANYMLPERMMIDLNDIYSLSDFQRKTREHVDRLKQTGKPAVLTVNGRAELVVQDAAAYQALLAIVDQAEAIIGIQRGLRSFERGEARPAEEVFDELMTETKTRRSA